MLRAEVGRTWSSVAGCRSEIAAMGFGLGREGWAGCRHRRRRRPRQGNLPLPRPWGWEDGIPSRWDGGNGLLVLHCDYS